MCLPKKVISIHNTHTLCVDGFQIIPHFLSKHEINEYLYNIRHKRYIENKHLIINRHENFIKKMVGDDYVFQDYIFIIEKSNIHTCHRDNNGRFYNNDQNYDSFTILIFLEDMERCLDVIPKSHTSFYKNAINLSDYTRSILCNPGDAVIFNANLIHAGSFNHFNNHIRIQMKITHKDDLHSLSFYNDYNKSLDLDSNSNTHFRMLQKNISCTYPILGDFTQNLHTRHLRHNKEQVSFLQKLFSFISHGNSHHFSLHNLSS